MPDSLPTTAAVARRTEPGRLGRIRLRVPMHLGTALRSWAGGSMDGSLENWLARITNGPLSSVVGGVGDTEEIQDAYLQASWFAACVDLRAIGSVLAKPRIWDRDPDDEQAQEVTDGPVFDLLDRVNPWMDPMELRIADQIHQELGNESLHLYFDRNGDPVRSISQGVDSLNDLPAMIVPVATGHASICPGRRRGPEAGLGPGRAEGRPGGGD